MPSCASWCHWKDENCDKVECAACDECKQVLAEQAKEGPVPPELIHIVEVAANSPLLHFSGGMQDLPRLLRLGPEGNSHPTWFVYLYADGTVILNLDRTEDIEFNVVDNWGNTEEMLSYLGLLVVRYG